MGTYCIIRSLSAKALLGFHYESDSQSSTNLVQHLSGSSPVGFIYVGVPRKTRTTRNVLSEARGCGLQCRHVCYILNLRPRLEQN